MNTRLRRRLVRQLLSSSWIRTPAVRDAFLEVPREIFIPQVVRSHGIAAAYRDEAYPTMTDDQGNAISSSSQPGIMALMLEELRVERGQRILEIGAGTGYNAAMLDHMVGPKGHVTSVELEPEAARQARLSIREAGQRATVVVGDGRNGFETNAPYDRIIVTASSLDVPLPFLEQLGQGGLLVLPLRLSDAVPFRQVIVTFERVGRRLRSVSVIHGGFMRLRDRPGDPSLPWPESKVVEVRDGTEQTLVSLSGVSWGRLTEGQRGDLLGLMLSRPRSRPIGMRVSRWLQWDLESFIVLAAPEELVAGCTRQDLSGLLFYTTAMPAIMDPGGVGLAHLAGRRTLSRLDAYGHRRAERRLTGIIDDWRCRGRPGIARLSLEVSYGRPTRKAWSTRRRGQCVESFDWT
jgi:protein-L-isoaspartate(D-aspartate) O-methyltransferase